MNMELEEVVNKLVGKITPTGDSSIDVKRLDNLDTLCNLVDNLVDDIFCIANNGRDSNEYSVLKISKRANQLLKYIHEEYSPINGLEK